MAKIISMFNHKGGVSKTTSTYHLGWMLANMGNKVILIDADSQCNLTNIVLGDDGFEEYYANDGANLKSAIAPVFENEPVPIQAFECLQVKTNENLLLIPGSFELSEYEVSLAVSFTMSESFSAVKNLPGSLFKLMETTALRYEADYILVDLNPSLSAFNQLFICSSDYFIVPASPDKFSILALRSLANILPKWESWAIRAREAFSNVTYPLPDKKPKFLGTIMQRFNIRSGRPTQANQRVIDQFDEVITASFVPAMATKDMLLNSYEGIENYSLGQVPDFQTLNAQYQQHGYPIFALTDEMFGVTGVVRDQYRDTRARFNTLYTNMATKIEQLTNA
ncbi:ParA family protein [Sulfuricurvum sp.]|uniref:ParA family protein n=1 Tax=Sulfuricurvum sp. TaxID=2025608 RepID=UPI002608993F|nr:ParA family protein [Sulfuricurvum sp.]MDD2265463.1 ParA family protein [Sulfuricurvum sp.]MDD2782880.1 ParA family protein [Sulfuricurvum sp.]